MNNARDIDMTHSVLGCLQPDMLNRYLSPVILGIANSCCALLYFVNNQIYIYIMQKIKISQQNLFSI